VHVDLIKIQAEFGARHPYRQAAKDIQSLTGNKRSINNKSRIHKITKRVGEILQNKNITQQKNELLSPGNAVSNDSNLGENISDTICAITVDRPGSDINLIIAQQKSSEDTAVAPAKQLCAAIDGGHVHDANNKGHNFEAMIAKVYRPENVIKTDKYHTSIIKKHCAGSAKDDKQKTMKNNLINAAKKEGIDRNITEVIVLADGAKNCWNIAKALNDFCVILVCILDWFHIGKYIQNLKKQLLSKHIIVLDQAREQLWLGQTNAAIDILMELKSTLANSDHIKKIENFLDYIQYNKARIVNYQARKNDGLIYSSHVAESSVEHLLNERSKRK